MKNDFVLNNEHNYGTTYAHTHAHIGHLYKEYHYPVLLELSLSFLVFLSYLELILSDHEVNHELAIYLFKNQSFL